MSVQQPPAPDSDAYELADPVSGSTDERLLPAPRRPAVPPGPTLSATAPPPAATPEPEKTQPEPQQPQPPAEQPKKPRKRGPRWDVPSWGVSLLVHAAVLVLLTFGVSQSGAVQDLAAQLDTALIDPETAKDQAEELVHIYNDPTDAERTDATVDNLSLAGSGGAPTATPVIRSSTAQVSESTSLAGLVKVAPPTPSSALLPTPAALNRDLGGRIGGDVTRGTTGYDEALDQLANEILRHLEKARVTVLWMFDESNSMKDDQATIRDKFDRVTNQLDLHVPADRKAAGDLEHAIIGFGEKMDFENSRPTADLGRIRKTISALPEDSSGKEYTMAALGNALGHYAKAIDSARKVLLVLVTDESGDDGDLVEQARAELVNRGVILYVLGRQAMFGFERVHLRYIDPVTKDTYWPTIRRGPETPGLELLQYDGLWQDRIDEQPSGLAPYELARLVEETGGIYFLLPNEEELRNRPRGEKAYPIATLKEYVPDYGSRPEYSKSVMESDLRRTLVQMVLQAKQDRFGFRRHYSVLGPELIQQMGEELPRVDLQLQSLAAFEKRLRELEPARDAEVDRRWQANYDIMLAQVVAYQVKAYEYRACLKEMIALGRQDKLIPKNPPIPGKRRTEWVIDHARDPRAPKEETQKYYAEAEALLKRVVERHADTPWADLAQTILDRGLSCGWGEWSVHPDYDERAKLVPNY